MTLPDIDTQYISFFSLCMLPEPLTSTLSSVSFAICRYTRAWLVFPSYPLFYYGTSLLWCRLGCLERFMLFHYRICCLLWFQAHVVPRSNLLFPSPPLRSSIEPLLIQLLRLSRFISCRIILVCFLSTLVRLCSDNLSVTYMSINPVQHDRNKDIVVDCHFVPKWIADGDLIIHYVPIRL